MLNLEHVPATEFHPPVPAQPEVKKAKNAHEPTEREQNKESAGTIEPTIRPVEATPDSPQTHDSTPRTHRKRAVPP